MKRQNGCSGREAGETEKNMEREGVLFTLRTATPKNHYSSVTAQ